MRSGWMNGNVGLGAAVLTAAVWGLCPASAYGQGLNVPVTDTVTLDFDAAMPSPDPVEFVADGATDDFDDNFAGEAASWGSFGGGPDSITAGIIENGGASGQPGDHAARLSVEDATPGGYFARLIWQVKGLRLAEDEFGTVGGDGTVQSSLRVDVSVDLNTSISDAQFRVNVDTGYPSINGVVTGNVPGLVETFGNGSRVLTIGNEPTDIAPAIPANSWENLQFSLEDTTAAPFNPFFFRTTRANDLTRIGVTFPGGGNPGDMNVDNFTLSGPGVMKFHAADFNTDEWVNATDIDMLYDAIDALALNESLPLPAEGEAPEFGVTQDTGATLSLAEKFSITPTDNELDLDDADYLVREVLGTEFGDFDLDGDVDAFDLGIWQTGFGTTEDASWAEGNADGDDDVDAFDLGIWQTGFGFGQSGAAVPEPASALMAMTLGVGALAVRRRRG